VTEVSEPPRFIRLNDDWNADPNDPDLRVDARGDVLAARIKPNAFVYPALQDVRAIELRFANCSRYRVTSINDEGWYRGQCRFSRLTPAWGEFYEITGDTLDASQPTPWVEVGGQGFRHFHVFLRDETLEVKAQDWSLRKISDSPVDPNGSSSVGATFVAGG